MSVCVLPMWGHYAFVPIVQTVVKLTSEVGFAKHPLPRLSLGNTKHLPSPVVCLR